jgi:hypothetical protein
MPQKTARGCPLTEVRACDCGQAASATATVDPLATVTEIESTVKFSCDLPVTFWEGWVILLGDQSVQESSPTVSGR